MTNARRAAYHSDVKLQPDHSAATPGFSIHLLNYDLPDELIAEKPADRREDARLLCIDRASGTLTDRRISDLPHLLRPDDLIVVNNTKVLQARFAARRRTGGRVAGLFVAEERPGLWLVMLEGSRKLRAGESLDVLGREQAIGVPPSERLRDASEESEHPASAVNLKLLQHIGDGVWQAEVHPPEAAEILLDRVGETPLPPYILQRRKRAPADVDDRSRYQTVYASAPGAIAAPTAGLHLTRSILQALRARGADIAEITLHVGLGTFKPVQVADLAQHRMKPERYELLPAAVAALQTCRRRGGRVVAVGTTCVRALESVATSCLPAAVVGIPSSTGYADAFIYPPYRFQMVDALLTNFHLPRSTLLALVMAFAGVDLVRRAYRHAIAERYRFYSYGDAMLIE